MNLVFVAQESPLLTLWEVGGTDHSEEWGPSLSQLMWDTCSWGAMIGQVPTLFWLPSPTVLYCFKIPNKCYWICMPWCVWCPLPLASRGRLLVVMFVRPENNGNSSVKLPLSQTQKCEPNELWQTVREPWTERCSTCTVNNWEGFPSRSWDDRIVRDFSFFFRLILQKPQVKVAMSLDGAQLTCKSDIDFNHIFP